MAAPGALAPSADSTRLYDIRFAALLAIIFGGFGSNALIQPILPVLILDQGGDASVVGLIFAAYAIPSVLLRPLIGRLVDTWSRVGVFLAGIIGCAIANISYLIPGVGAIFATRVFHGTAWAAFNTGGNSTLYELAPPSRRGEAAGVYTLVPGVSQMIMPAVGFILLEAMGFSGPFGLAAIMCLVGAALILVAPIPKAQPPAPPPTGEGFISSLIERSALLPMLFEFCWTSANTLFFVFPVVFVKSIGLPISELTLYYPTVGLTLVATRLLLGRRVDHHPRGPVLALGASMGIVALAVAATSGSIAQLTVAGAIYAAASCFTSPISAALNMDRLDPARRGAAMATYSLGYQLGIGTGAAAWGFVIAAMGFPAPYVLAIGMMVLMLVLLWGNRRELLIPPGTSVRRPA